jgi:hypothetical protein
VIDPPTHLRERNAFDDVQNLAAIGPILHPDWYVRVGSFDFGVPFCPAGRQGTEGQQKKARY